MPDFIHLTGVVNSAVAGTKLNDRQRTERTQRIGAFPASRHESGRAGTFHQTVRINATDNKTKRVTRRFKMNWRRPGLDQGAVVVGFVIITIKKQRRSPRVSRALVTTLFAAEVPFGTEAEFLSALSAFAANFCACLRQRRFVY